MQSVCVSVSFLFLMHSRVFQWISTNLARGWSWVVGRVGGGFTGLSPNLGHTGTGSNRGVKQGHIDFADFAVGV